MLNIDKDYSLIIHQTLQAILSPDKTLIDQAQQQLKVLQVRQGIIYFIFSILFI